MILIGQRSNQLLLGTRTPTIVGRDTMIPKVLAFQLISEWVHMKTSTLAPFAAPLMCVWRTVQRAKPHAPRANRPDRLNR